MGKEFWSLRNRAVSKE